MSRLPNKRPDMKTDYTIRRLTPADHLLWRAVRRAALVDAPAQFDEPLAVFDARDDADLQASLQRNTVCAAFAKDTPVAIAACHPAAAPRPADFLRLFSIWVQPAHRGQGIADRLIEHCIPTGKHAELLVRADNTPAIRAYERLGFITAPAPDDAKCFCATDNAPGIYMLRPPAP